MIEYVHTQLSIWGRWSVRKSTAAIGYPSVSPMFMGARFDGVYGSRPPVGVEVCGEDHVQDTDAAVGRLSVEQKRVVVEYYVVGGSAVDVARRLGMTRQRIYERLHALHQVVLGHMNDVAAGC